MHGENFNRISSRYDRTSVIQLSASEMLVKLLAPRRGERILDVGCGSGKITAVLAKIAGAKHVIGIDPSPGMIDAARKTYPGIEFRVQAAADMVYEDAFDAVFCNSAFQWFPGPAEAVKRFYAALKRGGRAGIQAPATAAYCPEFIRAVEAVASDPDAGKTFAHFRSPWCFLETAEDYAAMFEGAGFAVTHAAIDEVPMTYIAAKAYEVFASGAIAGYLGAGCYDVPIGEDYAARFESLVRGSFAKLADAEGSVTLHFRRIYLTAEKR